MSYNKTKIVFVLFAVLATLYAVNIFLTKNISDAIIDTPAKVSFMVIEPPKDQCENCFDAEKVIKMVDANGNIKYRSSNISYGSAFSKKYIKTYDIKNLPAVIVSGDIANKNISSLWKILSGEEKNGRIVIENLLPYYDIESGEVKGIMSAILLKDKTCKNCFDENKYTDALGRFGMFVGKTDTYDIASKDGKMLVRKYSITKIPALILSPDAGDYPGFASSWKDVGTIEKDGWFVFREAQKLDTKYESI